MLQAAARAEKRAIAAKGLTGDGYDGHVFWDTESFVLPVLTYTAPEAVRDALALAPLDARPRHRARAPAAPRRRRVPVADDPRPRVLGLLAGRHGRLPRQRRHRRRRAALPARDRRRRVRARGRGSSCWSRPPAVALAGPPRPARRVPHRRGHRARRVLGDRRRQRLHEPHGRPEPGRRGGVVRAPSRGGGGARGRRRGDGRLARRGRRDRRALRRRARGPPAVGGLHAPRALGLRGDGARRVPAAAALPLLRPLPQAGRQAGRPRARDGHWPAIASRRATRRAPSPTTSRSPSATRRCRRACRRSWPPRSATWSWPSTTSARPR